MTATYWAVITVFALTLFPRGVAIIGQFAMPGGFDFAAPRDQQSRLTGIYRRGQAAHLNGIEGFAPFAISVVMADQFGANPQTSSMLAIGYAVSRFLFVAAYLTDLNPWRTLVWMLGLACNIGLFVIAIHAGAAL